MLKDETGRIEPQNTQNDTKYNVVPFYGMDCNLNDAIEK